MIHIQNLSKTFNNNATPIKVLNHINLHVAPGDITGIIGLSGAGKSTLLRIIGGLDTPSEGTVTVNQKQLHTLHQREKISFHKEVGTIFQGYNLLMQKTVTKNISLPLEIAKLPPSQIKKRVNELLHLVGLEDKADTYPAQLSGGQKQRVAIARALANNPKILLCDEPTSALDCVTTKSILALLKNINAEFGITIVIITHDIAVVESTCNKVVVLHDAEIAESGLTVDVLSNPLHSITKKFLA